jgi:uncharacterized protein YjbI with pentapeptide repeats
MRPEFIVSLSLFAAIAAGTVALASYTDASPLISVSTSIPSPSAHANLPPAERIKAGDINCPHCDLAGADLSNQCVKHGDLTGADLDNVRANYMCMSYANFTGASFRGADLTGANLGYSNLSNADLTGARLDITSIKGADLSTAKGLTQGQIDLACGDAQTKLPPGLHVNTCL